MKRFSLTALILGGVLLLASCYQYMFIPVDIGNNSSQNENAWDGSTVDTSWYNPETNVFAITAPEQLAGLSALVNAETENLTLTLTERNGQQSAEVTENRLLRQLRSKELSMVMAM